MKIVIVGGVAGGATAAARIRRLDEKAEIVFLSVRVLYLTLTADCPITSAERLRTRVTLPYKHRKAFINGLEWG